MDSTTKTIENYADINLPRLERLLATDEGVFLLACDSFLEGLAVALDDSTRNEDFRVKIGTIRKAVHVDEKDDRRFSRAMVSFGTNRRLTNSVRHEFRELSKEDALAATERLAVFVQAISPGHPILKILEGEIERYWTVKRAPVELHDALRTQILRANELRSHSEALQSQVDSYQNQVLELNSVVAEKRNLENTLSEREQRLSTNDERVTSMRQRLFEAHERERKLTAEIEKRKSVGEYLEYLTRFTVYTRSREDYERSLLRLSPEQAHAVESVRQDGDHLVKGPAGTGKTLVVMHAAKNEVQEARAAQEPADERTVGVFTFTKSLARFNQYLASIVGSDARETLILHVDALFQREINEIGYRIDYDKAFEKKLFEKHGLPFIPLEQLILEINEFIFGNDLSREDYVDRQVRRRGLKKALSEQQRDAVWQASREIVREMEQTRIVTKYYGVCLLNRRVLRDVAFRRRLSMRRVFLDEAQDLTSVELSFFKHISSRGIVVVGDQQQMIYRIGGSYLQAGIDIRGRSHILKLNYRNTEQICRLSELYRGLDGEIDHDELGMGTAFRTGPLPELFVETSVGSIYEQLSKRVAFFLGSLGYEAENLAVIAPDNSILKAARNALSQTGIDSNMVRDPDFDFANSKGVRLATMHSAKGLEFPVVFLLVPEMRLASGIATTYAIRQQRNLVYVSLTRALDNLQVFMLRGTGDLSVDDIEGAFLELNAEYTNDEDHQTNSVEVEEKQH